MVRVVSTSPVSDTDADLGESYTDTAGCPAGQGCLRRRRKHHREQLGCHDRPSLVLPVLEYGVDLLGQKVVSDSETSQPDKSDGVTVTAYVLCGKP